MTDDGAERAVGGPAPGREEAPNDLPGGERGTAAAATRLKRALVVLGRVVRRVERMQVRAMALTYISLFALVPALVVAFSVVQAFTGMDRIAAEVHEFLLQNLAVGARASIEPYLDRFVRNAHAARAGVVGAALLLWSAYSLYSNTQAALNELWEVRRRRSVRVEALVYWTGITLGPVLLAASAVASQVAQAFLASRGATALALSVGAALSSLTLTLIYLVVPSARVRLGSALAGGVAAGVAWEVAKWLFTLFVARFVRYSAIYGSVAAVPIFLTWLYLSWFIVLVGARLAFVVQYGSASIAADGSSARAWREVLAVRAMVLVARAFQAGSPAPSPEQVVRALRAGPGTLDVLEALGGGGLLRALAGGGLVPARAPEGITLLDVRRALLASAPTPKLDVVAGVIAQADERSDDRLRQTTIRDLLAASTTASPALDHPFSPHSGPDRSLPGAFGS